MSFRTYSALLLLVSACATTEPSPREPVAQDTRLANLHRAALYPWTDGGRCVVQHASLSWRGVANKRYYALDKSRVRFQDTVGACPVASTSAIAVPALVGICLCGASAVSQGPADSTSSGCAQRRAQSRVGA